MAFHDVLSKDLKNFETNLFFLKCKTNVTSLDNYFGNRLVTDKINVVITFDDGYKSWVTNVLPILKKLELPATFFISSGFVGLTKEEETEFKRRKLFRKLPPREISGGLSLSDFHKLTDAGYAIGGHTVNHVDLTEALDIGRLKHEIAEDKRWLEHMTGRNISYFSYPTGAFRNPQINLVELLREADYKAAVTTVAGFNTEHTNPFLLRRDIIYTAMPINIFKAHVLGESDAIKYIKKYIFIGGGRSAD